MVERKKILLVDDEVALTNMMKLILERSGAYIVKIQNRGSEGFATAKQFKPDLAIVDIVMPDTEGSTVARMIKEDPELQNTKIAFLTATLTREEIGPEGAHIGGFPFIAKPVSEKELLEFVKKQLGS